MNENHNSKLTSAEMGNLWNFYMANSMSHCMFQHFLATVEDQDIKKLIQQSDQLSVKIMQFVDQVFQNEEVALPNGFHEQDVNVHAPRLFSDIYYLQYLDMMYKLGVIFYSITLPNTSRLDVRHFIAEVNGQAIQLSNSITELMLSKGIYVRPPYIPAMEKAEIIDKQSFFNGFFGDKRTLLGVEMSQLFANICFNTIKSVLLIGFSQVVKSDPLTNYFLRGKEINFKQHKIFSDYLKKEGLPLTMPSQFEVTTSTESPYSDKLMLFHITNLSSAKIRNFGDSIAVSSRHDLASSYVRLVIETGNYAEYGANLLIENGWMEQAPYNVDRNRLAKLNKER